jgi:predicted nucleic-acid-binding protein
MLAVDTNVLVRLVTNDDPAQARRALSAIERNDIFVGKTVLLELEWVLRYSYELEPDVIFRTLRNILGSGTCRWRIRQASRKRSRCTGRELISPTHCI